MLSGKMGKEFDVNLCIALNSSGEYHSQIWWACSSRDLEFTSSAIKGKVGIPSTYWLVKFREVRKQIS
jgi:hypothetical protein